MKKTILMPAVSILLLSCSGCWTKLGTLTVASTRNFSLKEDYVLLSKNVEGKVKNKGYERIQNAIDEAVKKEPTGEFMENVSIFVKKNGRKIKVVGDVWGIQSKSTLNETKK